MNKTLIAAITTMLVGFLAFSADYISSLRSKDTEMISVLYERVGSLETMYTEVLSQNQSQVQEITKLNIQLAAKYLPDEALKEYLDNMPLPAWVKIVREEGGRPQFVMWYLNKEYEESFGIKKDLYIGKTDFDIWPKEIALGFYENDLSVFESLVSSCEMEEIKYTPLGPRMEGPTDIAKVCKWVTKIRGERAIAGQLLPTTSGGT